MPNQMIALQSRGAKMPDPTAQTAKFVNMMNMAKQQEAAQRQALLAQQTMDINQAQEARAAALQPSALTKAESDAGVAKIKYVMDFYNASANDIANARDPEQAVARGERLKQQFTDPALQARIDETIGELVSDPSKFEENRKRILIRTLDAKDQFAVTHKDVFDADGNLILMETSPTGSFPTRVTPGVITNLPNTAGTPDTAPRTPTAPQAMGTGADMRATQGSNTTPQDLRDQGMNPRNIPSGMPTSPASFTGMGGAGAAQITPEVMSRIADSAFQTGVMAQVDFDQLLATQPPENRQAFTDAFRRANITIQADAPSLADSAMGQQLPMGANPVQTPQSQFADMRGPAPQSQTAGLRGAPPMEQTLAQYRVGQQVKGKNPNVAPFPASAQVPPSVLAAQEAAKTTAQEQAKEAAAAAAAPALAQRERNISYSKERGTADAKFMESASSVVEASNEGRNILNQMIGDAYIDKRGKIVVPKGGRRPHSGFEGVVGLGFPGMRFVPGSPEADFDKKFKQVIGKAFLKAFNDLRGGGSITEVEGIKATEAITRLSRSSSEVEFIRAARELEDILAKGEQRALDRRARIEGKPVPRAATTARRTPVRKELVFNPATGDFD